MLHDMGRYRLDGASCEMDREYTGRPSFAPVNRKFAFMQRAGAANALRKVQVGEGTVQEVTDRSQ